MYEFIDIDRYEAQESYYDFIESSNQNLTNGIKTLKDMIKKDPDFFDLYITLSERYYAKRKPVEAYEIIKKGYGRAMKLIINKGRFPDKLRWFIENRHIIRMIFNYAMLMWESNNKDEALSIFAQLLASNPNDNIGARYAIVALLEGMGSMGEYERKFASKDGYLDGIKVEKWFEKVVKKYPSELGWWFEIDDSY
jgi:tetratricopeptide (TPR) repeat protein